MGEYGIVGGFTFIGALFVGGAMITSWLIAPRSPETPAKRQPYECGEAPIGTARIQFKMGFYLFALMFLIFDVESLFLFPCVAIFKKVVNGEYSISVTVLFVEIAIFIFILAAGLIYAWKKKVLEWE